jgi:hypothetical protein
MSASRLIWSGLAFGLGVLLSPTSGAADDDPISFHLLPIEPEVTTFALTEDDQYLVVAHEDDDKLSIWSVQNQQLVATADCPSPRFVLPRGDRLFVANHRDGTICVFSTGPWELLKQVQTGLSEIYYLSAPQGAHFADHIIVTGINPHSQPRPLGGLAVVNVEDDSHQVIHEQPALLGAAVDFEGKEFLLQHGNGQIREVLDWSAALQGNVQIAKSPGSASSFGLLHQIAPGRRWFGLQYTLEGFPVDAKRSRSVAPAYVVPDPRDPVFYALKREAIECYSLIRDLPLIGDRKAIPAPEKPNRPINVLRSRSYSSSRTYYQNCAVRDGERLMLFVLDEVTKSVHYANTTPFLVPGLCLAVAEMPAQIESGQEHSWRLRGEEEPTTLQFRYADVDKAGKAVPRSPPLGLLLTDDGHLRWTPRIDDLGHHRLTITATTGGRPIRFEWDVEVLYGRPDGPASESHDGRFSINGDLWGVQPSRDTQRLLVHHADELLMLGADARSAVARHKLSTVYRRLEERDEYFVGLGQGNVDLLDKDDLKVQKSIALPGTDAYDLALHPARRVAYATIRDDDDGQRDLVRSRCVVEIDEESGAVRELPRLYGTHVEADPTGQRLYVMFQLWYEQAAFSSISGRVVVDRFIDVLSSYDLRSPLVRHIQTNREPGVNGSHTVVSRDGRYVAYVSRGGLPDEAYAIPIFKSDDIESPAFVCQLGRHPRDVCFHPLLDWVAAVSDDQLVLMDCATGETLADRVKLDNRLSEKLSGHKVAFSPDGTHLVLAVGSVARPNELRSTPLLLTEEEKSRIAKGIRPPRPSQLSAVRSYEEPIPATGPPADVTKIQALKGRGATRPVTARDIAKHFTPAVVLIEGEGSGTGFVVGADGLILTCAHVLPLIGEPTVSYQIESESGKGEVKRATATTWRVDEQNDLALLKIPVSQPLRTVQLRTTGDVESAEEVTVIGNPGLGETILTNTVTTGVVSNPRREFDGAQFIQTSAAVNPGNSGGPMFDNRGRVIGVVVAKANIEARDSPSLRLRSLSFWELVRAALIEKNRVGARLNCGYGRQYRAFPSHGELVKVEDQAVHLRRESGDVIQVPLERLSEVDRAFLNNRSRRPAVTVAAILPTGGLPHLTFACPDTDVSRQADPESSDSGVAPLAGQEIERYVALDRDPAQPAGELVDHESSRDPRGVDRAADVQLPRSASRWAKSVPA